MAIGVLLIEPIIAHPFLALIFSPILLLVLQLLYRISPLHPLAHIPGPYLACLSNLWILYHAWIGDECTAVHELHERYGSIIRTGPWSVDVADGEALHGIYVEKGGFRKADFYMNFDFDGFSSIFSARESAHSKLRSKAVAALFSTANLRQARAPTYECVNKWIMRIRAEAKTGKPFDILTLSRALALDATTLYTFGRSYGCLDEDSVERKLVEGEVSDRNRITSDTSINGMINALVDVGQYWYLPNWAFLLMLKLQTTLQPNHDVLASFAVVNKYSTGLVKDAVVEKSKYNGTFQARLLEAGFSEGETKMQCEDLMFAGTDSAGMVLAMLLFNLVKHPNKYEKLKKELSEAKASDDDVLSLPYLKAVVREGLRLSMTTPTRLVRIVPAGGWTFKDVYFPAATEISCTPYELLLNDKVYKNPFDFEPERWLDPTDEMNRDAFYFGAGPRKCIAMNLATLQLTCATQRLVEEDLLQGARRTQDEVKILEWFNSKVVGGKIELVW